MTEKHVSVTFRLRFEVPVGLVGTLARLAGVTSLHVHG